MGYACIINTNDRGRLLLEYLSAQGRIKNYEFAGYSKWCFEFDGTVEITFDDYLAVHPYRSHIERFETKKKMERESFNRWILLEIIKTLRGGEVAEFIPGTKIALRSTEKTETICVRVTPEEKEKLEREAQQIGATLSEYVRAKILSANS